MADTKEKPRIDSEDGEIEGERGVEVEQEPLPWEKLRREGKDRIIEEYEQESALSEESRESINLILQQYLPQEADQRTIDFAKEWFEEHKDEIKEKGYDVRTKEEGYIVKVVNELGGFDDLEKDKKYREVKEAIDGLYALTMDLKKEKISIESQFLMLNALNKKAEKLKKEIDEAAKKGKDSAALEGENERLFQLMEELSESITGRDLRKEAEEKVESLEDKEEYISKNLPERLGHIKDYLQELDYRTEKTGILMRRKTRIINEKGEIIGEFRKEKEMNEFLRKKTEEKVRKEIVKEWDEKDSSRVAKIGDLVKREIRALAKTPEEAEGGIEEVYARVKKRLKTEFIERGLRKGGKTKEQLKRIEEEFRGRGRNPTELIDGILRREGSLGGLKGDWEEDQENISNFLEIWGVSVDSKDLNKFKEKMNKSGKSYEREVRKEKGFVAWLLEFLLLFTSKSSESEKKEVRKGKK